MIPILIYIIAAVLTGGIGIGIGIGVFWDEIQKKIRGKRIAVLGVRAVGKTTLMQFLMKGTIPEKYFSGQGARSVTQDKALKLEHLELILKDATDFPGDSSFYQSWKEEYLKADIIFYLLRTDHVLNGNPVNEKRISEDFSQINLWKKDLKDTSRRRPFFIVGTYCDSDPDYEALSEDNVGNYIDKFRKLPIIGKSVAMAGNDQHPVKVVLGSTLTKNSTRLLVLKILNELKSMDVI